MTKSLALLIALVLIIFCALGFGEYRFNRQRETEDARKAHQDLLREVRLAQADGISLDRNSLKPPALPPAEDAGPVYDEIAAELKVNPFNDKPLWPLISVKAHYPPTATEVSQARLTLQQHTRLLALVHKALARKHCVLRRDWDAKDPTNTPFALYSGVRQAARILSAESMLMASEGRVQEAIRNQALGFRIADHCESGKTLIPSLVGYAANAIALNGMRKILYSHGDDPAVANSVSKAIADNAHNPNITSALRAEATMQYAEIDYFRTLNPKFVMGAPRNASYGQWKIPSASVSKDQQNAYLDATEAAVLHRQRMDILASEHPFPEAKVLLDLNKAAWIKRGDSRTGLALAGDVDWKKYVATGWRDRASALIVETATRLLIWKSHHGAFPKALNAIGKTPPDPFSGKPFGYRREGVGFVLYSVDDSGAFGGGSPNVKPQGYPPMFRYPVPVYNKLP